MYQQKNNYYTMHLIISVCRYSNTSCCICTSVRSIPTYGLVTLNQLRFGDFPITANIRYSSLVGWLVDCLQLSWLVDWLAGSLVGKLVSLTVGWLFALSLCYLLDYGIHAIKTVCFRYTDSSLVITTHVIKL